MVKKDSVKEQSILLESNSNMDIEKKEDCINYIDEYVPNGNKLKYKRDTYGYFFTYYRNQMKELLVRSDYFNNDIMVKLTKLKDKPILDFKKDLENLFGIIDGCKLYNLHINNDTFKKCYNL